MIQSFLEYKVNAVVNSWFEEDGSLARLLQPNARFTVAYKCVTAEDLEAVLVASLPVGFTKSVLAQFLCEDGEKLGKMFGFIMQLSASKMLCTITE